MGRGGDDDDEAELNAMMGRKRLGFCWGRHGNDFLLWKTRPRNERELVRLPFGDRVCRAHTHVHFLTSSLLRVVGQVTKQPPQQGRLPDSVWTGNLEAPLAESHKVENAPDLCVPLCAAYTG
jgi:hypothetical protein